MVLFKFNNTQSVITLILISKCQVFTTIQIQRFILIHYIFLGGGGIEEGMSDHKSIKKDIHMLRI